MIEKINNLLFIFYVPVKNNYLFIEFQISVNNLAIIINIQYSQFQYVSTSIFFSICRYISILLPLDQIPPNVLSNS